MAWAGIRRIDAVTPANTVLAYCNIMDGTTPLRTVIQGPVA